MTNEEMIAFYKGLIPRLISENHRSQEALERLQKQLDDVKKSAEYWERAYRLSKLIEYEHYVTISAGGVVYDYKNLLPKKEHQDQLQTYKDNLEQM